jgi:transposase
MKSWLIAPQYVKPYVKRQKNDAHDAAAIAEAASRPTMRFVTTKTTAQQGLAMVLKTRDLFTAQRTQTINALRGHLAEHGIVAPKGPQHLPRLERAVAESADHLPPEVIGLCKILFDLIAELSDRIDALTRQLRQIARQNDVACRSITIPGIGPVTAVSIAVLAAPPEMFSKGRDFAAWIGLAPRQHQRAAEQGLVKYQRWSNATEAFADHWCTVGHPGSTKARWCTGGIVARSHVGAQTKDAGCSRTGKHPSGDMPSAYPAGQ